MVKADTRIHRSYTTKNQSSVLFLKSQAEPLKKVKLCFFRIISKYMLHLPNEYSNTARKLRQGSKETFLSKLHKVSKILLRKNSQNMR